jgi:hypothetical protein
MKRTQIKPNLTAQLSSDHAPPPGRHSIALFIHCPDCQTMRGFRIGATIDYQQKGELGPSKIVTYCSTCLRQFEISFGLVLPEPGWSKKAIFNDDEELFGVIDQMGLEPLQHAAKPAEIKPAE